MLSGLYPALLHSSPLIMQTLTIVALKVIFSIQNSLKSKGKLCNLKSLKTYSYDEIAHLIRIDVGTECQVD